MARRAAIPGQVDLKQVGLLHRLLGETFAAAARQSADRASMSLQRVQCLGCSGHTIFHEPEGRFPSTLALGMAATVAERTGVTTVSDFRARDMSVGGQGAPWTAAADYLLLGDREQNRLLIHLGGLVRVVHIPAGAKPQHVVAFEAGPCNLLLNGLIRRLTAGKEESDAGGKHAVQGRCQEDLLQRWLGQPYLLRRPPKSLPRQSFVDEFIHEAAQSVRQSGCSVHDILCTASHFVARSVATALRRFLPESSATDRIYISGEGARNGLLWRLLEERLTRTPLHKIDELGIAAEALKATSVAVLAALTVDGVAGNLPAATGAAGSRLLGSLTPGASSNWARCLAWMANQTAPLAAGLQSD
jgi:anhydro-N-acetylmuramic acid kinase